MICAVIASGQSVAGTGCGARASGRTAIDNVLSFSDAGLLTIRQRVGHGDKGQRAG